MVFDHESIGMLLALVGFGLWAQAGFTTRWNCRVPVWLGEVALWCSVLAWFLPALDGKGGFLVAVPMFALWWAVREAAFQLDKATDKENRYKPTSRPASPACGAMRPALGASHR